MSIVYMRREGGQGLRLAVITPKRTGNAVRRNRIRRILREEFRLERRIADARIDAVVLWKAPIADQNASAGAAHREARGLLEKIRI
mgnify:CR=1 FL=1